MPGSVSGFAQWPLSPSMFRRKGPCRAEDSKVAPGCLPWGQSPQQVTAPGGRACSAPSFGQFTFLLHALQEPWALGQSLWGVRQSLSSAQCQTGGREDLGIQLTRYRGPENSVAGLHTAVLTQHPSSVPPSLHSPAGWAV